MRGLRKRRLHASLVAKFPIKTLVVGGFVVHQRAALERALHVDNRRQLRQVECHELSGIFRLLIGLGDNPNDRITDMAHLARRKDRMFRLDHRLVVFAGHEPAARHTADRSRRVDISLREDGDDTRRGFCARYVDLVELRVRNLRAQNVEIRLMRQIDIVGVAANALQKPEVFAALHGGADACTSHVDPPCSCLMRYSAATLAPLAMFLAAICTAFTMLW